MAIVNNGSGRESMTRAKGLPVWVALGRMRVICYWGKWSRLSLLIDTGGEGKEGKGTGDKGRTGQKTGCCVEKKERKGIQEAKVRPIYNKTTLRGRQIERKRT